MTIKRWGRIIMYEVPSYILQKPSSWPKTIHDYKNKNVSHFKSSFLEAFRD